jgi:hypothetical protein
VENNKVPESSVAEMSALTMTMTDVIFAYYSQKVPAGYRLRYSVTVMPKIKNIFYTSLTGVWSCGIMSSAVQPRNLRHNYIIIYGKLHYKETKHIWHNKITKLLAYYMTK